MYVILLKPLFIYEHFDNGGRYVIGIGSEGFQKRTEPINT